MPDARDTAFDQLVRSETLPPEHREGFAERLAAGMDAVDAERGWAGTGRRHLRPLLIAAAVAAVALTVAGLIAGGSSEGPSVAEQEAIQSTIARLWAAKDAALAPQTREYARYATSPTLPRALEDEMEAGWRAALRVLGTPEFVAQENEGGGSWATANEAGRGVGDVLVRSESEVLDVQYRRTLPNGDVVVWAEVWGGDVARHYDSGTIGVGPALTARVDGTPTYQYQVRGAGGEWRIVAETLVYSSEDTSAEYGPDTPHYMSPESLVRGDDGLVLD
jgi:hypothetical protein